MVDGDEGDRRPIGARATSTTNADDMKRAASGNGTPLTKR
jgi:hypothetical protein